MFIPGGFAEGSTTCLFTRDGRYTGALHLNSESPLPISDAAVETLIALQRVVAPVMDAIRPPDGRTWTELLEDAAEAALLTPDGRLVTLPGLRRDGWLADDSPLFAELIAAGHDATSHRFAWVSPHGPVPRGAADPARLGCARDTARGSGAARGGSRPRRGRRADWQEEHGVRHVLGDAQTPRGVCAARASRVRSSYSAVMCVVTNPGATAFTLMPWAA